jgi:anti-sigma regulatory factor (Ser/Thr protein kinase)
MMGGRVEEIGIASVPSQVSAAHLVLPYSGSGQCASAVLGFLAPGLARHDPVCVAVSRPVAEALREAADRKYAPAGFHDIAELARNPGRLIAALWEQIRANRGRRVWWVTEPAWPGRSPAEMAETVRHEVLVNLAFRRTALSLLCLYDTSHLDGRLIRGAVSAHPAILAGGHAEANGGYLGAGVMPRDYEQPLDPPPPAAAALAYSNDLRPVRAAVTAHATRCGLSADRTVDLVLAVSEVAANSLRHAGGMGVLRTWRTEDEVVCQVEDDGTITDPLAGRRRAASDADGHGLWVVNQVCDLVELRSARGQTTVRMHMRR